MANSISNATSASAAINTLLRAQMTTGSSLKVSKKDSQTIIDQLQSSNQKIASATPAPASGGGNLPRGSLVDILA